MKNNKSGSAVPYFCRQPQGSYYPAMVLILSALLALPASAARAPDVGALGNQLRQPLPAPAPPSGAPLSLPDQPLSRPDSGQGSALTVVIQQVQFQGLAGTPVSPYMAQQAVAGFLHKPLGFNGLLDMADAITALARGHGMLLAQAVLPPQPLKDGILTIRLIPGRYDQAQISNQARIRGSLTARIVRHQAPAGKVILRADLERTALLLDGIPGISAGLTLQPGRDGGTSSLNIEVLPGRRYAAYLSADSTGDPVTGRARAIAAGQLNGVLGLGDQLQLTLLRSYQRRGLTSGSLDYSLLAGGNGSRAGLSYSRLHYGYSLQGLRFNGDSGGWSLYFIHPWVRRLNAGIDVRTEGGQQYLTDRFPAAFSAAKNQRRVSTGSLAVSGSLSGSAGQQTEFILRGTRGRAQGHGALEPLSGSGHFARFNYQLSHLRQLTPVLSLYAGIKGQLVNVNADSSQKFLLGGADAVRAYDTGSGAVDSGWLFSTELRGRWPLPLSGRPELSAALFYDQGTGSQFRNNFNPQTGAPYLRQHNRLSLSGAGVSLSLAVPGSYSLSLTYARRTGRPDPASGYSGAGRLWLSALKVF